MSNKTYDILKWIVIVFIPAFITLYTALGSIWNFANVEAVVGTIAAIGTFIGAIVGVSSVKYKKGKDTADE